MTAPYRAASLLGSVAWTAMSDEPENLSNED